MKVKRYKYRDIQKWPSDSTRCLLPTIVLKGFSGYYVVTFAFWIWKACFTIKSDCQ